MKSFSQFTTLAVLGFGLAGISGCDSTTVGEPLPYYASSLDLKWDSNDIRLLNSLSIDHAGSVEFFESSTADQMSVTILFDVQLDVEPGDHVALQKEFEKAFFHTSTPNGKNPNLVTREFTGPHECKETRDSSGKLTELKGICIRGLLISMPKSLHLPLFLSWKGSLSMENREFESLSLKLRPDSRLRMKNIATSLHLNGGGPNTFIEIDGLLRNEGDRGNLISNLTEVTKMELHDIDGKILLKLDSPERSLVKLDELEISQFPFDRPAL